MSWLGAVIVGWVFGFVLPKSIILPVFRGMYRAMRASEARDADDAAWLADWEARQRRGGGGPTIRRRLASRPRPPRPPAGLGPVRHARRQQRRRPAGPPARR